MRFEKRRVNIWVVIVAAIVVLSILSLLIQAGDTSRDIYVGTATKPTPTETERAKTLLRYYTVEENNISYGVPQDWTPVIKDGWNTYVHTPTGTSMQIRIEDYTPLLLQMNETQAYAYALGNGGTLSSFSWLDRQTFQIIYNKGQQERTTSFMDVIRFDRKTAVTVSISVTAQYYKSVAATIDDIMNAFSWQQADPWPDGTLMYYSEFGSFEFSYPADWVAGSTENAYIVQDQQTGAAMSVAVSENQTSYSSVTQIEYVEAASRSRSNFYLQSFAADERIIYALATFTANDMEYVLVQYFLAGDRFEYVLTFETPQAVYPQQAGMFDAIIKAFRYYPSEEPVQPTEDTDTEETSDATEPGSVFVPETTTPTTASDIVEHTTDIVAETTSD